MTKCYYCGRPDGSHSISCICGKSPARNAANRGDAEKLQAHRAGFDRKMADPLHRALAERAGGPNAAYEGRSRDKSIDNGMWSPWGPISAQSDGEARTWADSSYKQREWRKVAAAERTSSATSGEVVPIKPWRERVAGCEHTQELVFYSMQEEIADLRAALAAKAEREAAVLRRLLAWRVSGGLLYADDGELQDNTAWPHIDFKRDTVDAIETKLGERSRAAIAAKAEQLDSPADVPYRVAEFWSSSQPGTKVRMLAEGGDIEQWGKRGDFIRWVDAPVAERAAAADDVSAYKAWLAKLHPCVTNIDPFYAFKAGRASSPEVAQPAAQGERAAPSDSMQSIIEYAEQPHRNGHMALSEVACRLRSLATPAPTAGTSSAAKAVRAIPSTVWWHRDGYPVFNNQNGDDLVLRKSVLAALAAIGDAQ